MPATVPSPNKTPLICPACTGQMVLISIAPNCKGVVYGYLCSNDGGRLNWQPPNARAERPVVATMDDQRERAIRETWLHLGQVLWNSRTHGAGAPLKVAGCEYRLERRKIDGREQPCIVCEDIVI